VAHIGVQHRSEDRHVATREESVKVLCRLHHRPRAADSDERQHLEASGPRATRGDLEVVYWTPALDVGCSAFSLEFTVPSKKLRLKGFLNQD
jgi:hypothetical protein